MKAKRTLTAICAALLSALPTIASAQLGGDPTTPPAGAPSRVMKSLDQMEPRTPLVDGAPGVSVGTSGTITISQSGSYYLTENLSVTSGEGIRVNADGVTLDLRGFTITSSSAVASSVAINLGGSHISVFNGHIISGTTYYSGSGTFVGGGFSNGVYAGLSYRRHIRIRDLFVRGCSQNGIFCSDLETSQVEACSVSSCGSVGIRAAVVSHSTSEGCGSTGIIAETVSHCRSETVNGNAINADLVSNSYGRANGSGDGIEANNVQNSYGYASSSSGFTGIQATSNVTNSYGVTAGIGDGIEASNVQNSYGYANSLGVTGIDAGFNVTNSYGRTLGSGDGIEARSVQNSYGNAGSSGITGINASFNVTNSSGHTTGSGDGIEAGVISYSYGTKFGTGAGNSLQCDIAIGCTSRGVQDIDNRYLMP